VVPFLPSPVFCTLPAVRRRYPSFLEDRPPDIDELSTIHPASAPVSNSGSSFTFSLINHIMAPQLSRAILQIAVTAISIR
jgi:hypothetical protein